MCLVYIIAPGFNSLDSATEAAHCYDSLLPPGGPFPSLSPSPQRPHATRLVRFLLPSRLAMSKPTLAINPPTLFRNNHNVPLKCFIQADILADKAAELKNLLEVGALTRLNHFFVK